MRNRYIVVISRSETMEIMSVFELHCIYTNSHTYTHMSTFTHACRTFNQGQSAIGTVSSTEWKKDRPTTLNLRK